jgi:hypothetical protein
MENSIQEKEQTPYQPLDEVVRFKGAGIVIEVRARDQGVWGNPDNPAHAHVFDSSGTEELAEIILTETPPKKTVDILYYRTDKVHDGLSKIIVKFAEMTHPASKYIGVNLTNWQAVIYQWNIFHGE